jgi:acyl-CoA carboxylase epsilon subunit
VTEPLRVIKGNPTEEELAALLMVFRGRASPAEAPPDPPMDNGWAAYWRSLRAPIRPGPGVWRASGREG